MTQFIIKIAVSAFLVAAISEVAKRHSLFAAVTASLPIISILVMIFLYIETKDVVRISELSYQIFWFVLPSLALFLFLPVFIKYGFGFWLGLGAAAALTSTLYLGVMQLIK
jgi:hypothetical protein